MCVNSFNLQPYEGEIMIIIYLELKEITFSAQDHTGKQRSLDQNPSGSDLLSPKLEGLFLGRGGLSGLGSLPGGPPPQKEMTFLRRGHCLAPEEDK